MIREPATTAKRAHEMYAQMTRWVVEKATHESESAYVTARRAAYELDMFQRAYYDRIYGDRRATVRSQNLTALDQYLKGLK